MDEVIDQVVSYITGGHGYSSLRSNFLCGFQICKPCRSIT